MSLSVLIVVLVVLMAVMALLVVLLAIGAPFGPKKLRRQAAVSDSLRALVVAQRNQGAAIGKHGKKESLALAAAAEADLNKKKTRSSSHMTLAKKLRYARWPITSAQFRALQTVAAIALFVPAYIVLGWIWWFMSFMIGWTIVGELLNRSVNYRFRLFDGDYPVLLMSYVSLLKTGMSTISGLESAAKGLDTGSLVRNEVELLIERLRLGLTEEQAISSFGEDVAHPEIELFVQGLLLSRRVGGQLSSTLERLAKQVRKRQEFRNKAIAAVGMERSSIYFIAAIMTGLIFFLTFKSPDLVIPAFSHPTGQKMWQAGIACIVIGFYWMTKVTKIKV